MHVCVVACVSESKGFLQYNIAIVLRLFKSLYTAHVDLQQWKNNNDYSLGFF